MGVDTKKAVGYHGAIVDGKPVLANHLGEVGYDADWFLSDHSGEDYKKIAYDLDAFVAVLLKAMGLTEEEGKRLNEKRKLHYYAGDQVYDITYYPSKYLGVTRGAGWGRPYAGLYNIEQYLEGGCHYGVQEPTIELCVEMCKVRAMQARDKAVEVSQSFYKLGLDPNTLTSPVRSMEKSLLKDLDVPTHLDIPPAVNDMAMRCCPGNWVEAYKLGHWEKSYDLDITGAYASVLAELLDIRRGEWIQHTEMPQGAVYGFADGVVTIDAGFSPIFYSKGEEHNFTTTGTWDTSLTKQKIDFIAKYKLGHFKIEDAWWWVNTGVKRNPYKGIVNHLFRKRSVASKLEDKILKRCLAGLWGRTLHTRIENGQTVYGDAFNPVYGAIVETDTSLEVARMVLDNNLYPDHLLHIAVDGILVDEPVGYTDSVGLGSWRISHTGGAIIVNSGVAAVEGKEGAEDFAINYDWLLGAIKSKPRATKYTMSKVSLCTLAKAINTDFKKLGMLETIKRDVVIGNESKRLYWDMPKTGKQLLSKHYDSEPLDMALIKLGV